MPPLRTRVGDVETLANYFLRAFAAELGRPSLQFEDSALEAIRLRDWPGNVRELISCVKRAVVMARSDSIGLGDLGFAPFSSAGLQSGQSNGSISLEGLNLQELSLAEAKNRIECALIQEMLAREQNVTRAAEQLQISRVTLYRLMNKHGIQLH
jgi:DNA-binding NtrC family response regulator